MFDSYARSLLVDVPELEGLTGEAAARGLSQAYLSILQFRTNGANGSDDPATNQAFLRQLANSLLFQIVLDDTRQASQRRAAAFVSAEAIALLADFVAMAVSEVYEEAHVFLAERFARIEAAILYLYAEYDACAAGVLTLTQAAILSEDRIDEQAAVWCLGHIESLCRLAITSESSSPLPFSFRAGDVLNPQGLERDTIGRLYAELGSAVIDFSSWLTGTPTALEAAIGRLDSLLAALSPSADTIAEYRVGHDYARVFHLATLLRLCFPALGERALCHIVPPPDDADSTAYRNYLQSRAAGTASAPGRPLLWPSAAAYVHQCILGDVKHAVVSMPTGSGKSFVGELATSQAIHSGWVLYLAPTNALAEQIRGDLRIGLSAFDTEIFAFIGDQEYSTFSSDTVTHMQTNSVAVMTPEKCALALRLAPDAFTNCTLVVFDECHLIGDSGSSRGATAELVLAQLMLRAPGCRFLLMSAILQNPEDLAGWLASATGGNASPVIIRWRPTRTLRAVLGVEGNSFQAAADTARAGLAALPDRRKRLAFTAKCSLAACLQGAWQSDREPDYGLAAIDCDAELSVSRVKRGAAWKYSFNADSWVNATAINLATRLVDSGIQTLVFTPASRHYPFSNGTKAELAEPTLSRLLDQPPLVEACRILAEYELGIESVVFSLLSRGVSVHTSLMLEVEKIASELSFKRRCTALMFATGTLAQGLNLPAIAVVIAGTRIGDPRGDDAEVVEQRKFSQLLNAAGRAGRAGFANQGVVITVPDQPIAFQSFSDVLNAREQADFLQRADDSVPVGSSLTDFLDNVCNDAIQADRASETELQVVALLTGGDDKQVDPELVLRRTYAAYLRQQTQKSEVTKGNVQRLIQVRDEFIAESESPEWLTVAAQRAGLDFFLTLGIFAAWSRLGENVPEGYQTWNVTQWLDEFLAAAALIPPSLLARHLPPERLARISDEFKELVKTNPALFYERAIDWKPPTEWQSAWTTIPMPLKSWMGGEAVVDIAAILTGKERLAIPSDRTQGKPIPRTLSVTGETWSSMSLIAGGFLAVAEQVFKGEVPLALACLPMCIKYGCDSPESLAWFRFGVRLRRASRLLAKRFPSSAELRSDEELRKWVSDQRRSWLKTDAAANVGAIDQESIVLAALRAFITS